MKNTIRFAFAAIAAALIASCSTTVLEINSTQAHDVDFSRFKTFYILREPTGDDEQYTRPKSFARSTVEEAVREQMTDHDYREVTVQEEADMLVAIQFSLKDEEHMRTTKEYQYVPTSYRNYGYGYGYGYRDYYGYAAIPHTTLTVDRFRHGNMVIDLIDREDNALIWEGFAQGEGEHSRSKIKERVHYVVGQIFLRYPHYASGK